MWAIKLKLSLESVALIHKDGNLDLESLDKVNMLFASSYPLGQVVFALYVGGWVRCFSSITSELSPISTLQDSNTVLHLSILQNMGETAIALINAGANIDSVNKVAGP